MHNLPVSPLRPVYLAKLHVLRDEFMIRSAKSARLSPVAHEWAALSREHRIVILMLAGVDECEEVAIKDWSEYTPAEVWVLQSTMRGLKEAMSGLVALVRR